MARKRPVWTRAMRRKAAEHGRQGNKAGKARGGRAGGKLAWCKRTPEERAAILERLRTHRGTQANSSPLARAAQAERGRKRWEAVRAGGMTPRQAAFLLDVGMLKTEPVPMAHTPAEPPGFPVRTQYADTREYLRAVDKWHADEWWRKEHGTGMAGNGDEEEE